MAVEFEIVPKSIAVHRDQFSVKKEDGSTFLATAEKFMDGPFWEADVVAFKRFIIHGDVSGDGALGAFRIEIDLRGNTVEFQVDENSALTHRGLFWCFECELGEKWNHRRKAEDERPLLNVNEQENDHRKPIVATARDGLWLAGIIHRMRDMGGFRRQVADAHGHRRVGRMVV